jgi:hypothetical protein
MPYRAYIEEAGDEGLGRGSRWFIVGAVLVETSQDLALSRSVDTIRAQFKLQPPGAPLHWRKIKHTSIRRGIIDLLQPFDFRLSFVICDTQHPAIQTSSLRGCGRLYFYLARLLVERISWFGAEMGQKVDLIFANRSNMSYQQLMKYLSEISQDKECRIKPGIIDFQRSRCLAAGQVKLLQVADICNGACFNSLERDQYGYSDERYFIGLWDKLYRHGHKLFSYGMKFLPEVPTDSEYPWLRRS